MELFLASPRGFCAGVVRAINTVKKSLQMFGSPIYVRHAIVHNKHVVAELEQKGAVFVKELSEVPSGSRVIYSAHGVSPVVREEAKLRSLIEIDATCGLVTKIHSAIKRYVKKGYKIILIGHKNHVEVIGAKGEAEEDVTVVETVEDVVKLSFTKDDKLFFATQTTLSADDVTQIVKALKERFINIETMPGPSVCYATFNRQRALRSLLKKVDIVFVVGDPSSSNSNRLKDIAKARGKTAFLINGPEEIQEQWLHNVNSIGMTAGASTPEEVVIACVEQLKTLGVQSVQEMVYAEENVVFALPSGLQN